MRGVLAILLAAAFAVCWFANPEPWLTNAVVEWGPACGSYTGRTNVAGTNCAFELAAGTWFVTARNVAGNWTSAPCREIVVTVFGSATNPPERWCWLTNQIQVAGSPKGPWTVLTNQVLPTPLTGSNRFFRAKLTWSD